MLLPAYLLLYYPLLALTALPLSPYVLLYKCASQGTMPKDLPPG